MVIAIDIDDVLTASTIQAWLDLYNTDYKDSLTEEDITNWNITQFIKAECGSKMYQYLDRTDFYDHIDPIEGALDGVNVLRYQGHEVFFATATDVHDNGRKFDWLVKHGFLDGSRHSQKDYMEIRHKGRIHSDILVDDSAANIQLFSGYGIMFDRPHNRTTSVHNTVRAYDWPGVVREVKEYERSVRW